jgi:nitrite reductase/ring-hydroxylating ferredoxin subunit
MSRSMRSFFAGELSALDEEGYFTARLPDGKDVLVLRCSGILYAIQRRCPHEGAPLEKGNVWDKMIRCGQHAFTFDLETGEGLNCPGYSIERYAVTEEDGKIFLSTADDDRSGA